MTKRIILATLLALVFLTLSVSANGKYPKAKQGVLDLRNWNFDTEGSLKLNGEWNFYWNQLIEPNEIAKSQNVTSIKVPQSWRGKMINGKEIDNFGCATYHLIVLLGEKKPRKMAINTLNIFTASKVFINNELIAEFGTVSDQAEIAKGGFIDRLIKFDTKNDTLDIVIQVSNYNFYKSGLSNILYLGKEEDIEKARLYSFGSKVFAIGALFIIALFFIIFYISRSIEKIALYFGIFALLMAIYNFFVGTPHKLLITGISFELQTNIIRIVQYLIPYLLVLFIKEAFREEYKKWTMYAFAYPFLILIVLTVVLPTHITSPFIQFFWYGIVLILLYELTIIYKALKNKRFGAKILLIGFIMVLVVAIHDVLFFAEIINTGSLIDLGLFLLIITWSFYLSARFANTLKENEKLALELYDVNRNLENIVKERTAEINLQKEEIITQAEQLLTTNQKLIELDYYKESLTQMIVHDLKSPLGVICGMPDILREGDNLNLIKSAGKQMLELVTNILDVQKYENSEMMLQKEEIRLKKMVDEAILHTQYIHSNKKINFKNLVSIDNYAYADKEILNRIFINIITNAIKYTRREGEIEINTIANNGELTIYIKDNGIGILPEMLDKIFDKYVQAQAKKAGNTRSTGLGLTFCKLAIEAHGGKIWAESEQEKGTTFYFTLPTLT